MVMTGGWLIIIVLPTLVMLFFGDIDIHETNHKWG